MPSKSSPGVFAVLTPAIGAVLSTIDVETEEKDDLDDDEVEGVTLELSRSARSVIGNVEGGRLDDEVERSSE